MGPVGAGAGRRSSTRVTWGARGRLAWADRELARTHRSHSTHAVRCQSPQPGSDAFIDGSTFVAAPEFNPPLRLCNRSAPAPEHPIVDVRGRPFTVKHPSRWYNELSAMQDLSVDTKTVNAASVLKIELNACHRIRVVVEEEMLITGQDESARPKAGAVDRYGRGSFGGGSAESGRAEPETASTAAPTRIANRFRKNGFELDIECLLKEALSQRGQARLCMPVSGLQKNAERLCDNARRIHGPDGRLG